MAVQQTSQSRQEAFDGGPQHYRAGFPQTTAFEYDPGVLVLPVASETSAAVKVRVHGGYTVRRVNFDVVRANNPPIIPKPEDIANSATGRDEVLVSCNLDIPLPSETPNDTGLTWQVRGEYVFVETKARVPGTDLLPLGGYPYSLGNVDQLAGAAYQAASGNLQALSELMKPLVASDKHLWPITVLPPFVFNGNLLKE